MTKFNIAIAGSRVIKDYDSYPPSSVKRFFNDSIEIFKKENSLTNDDLHFILGGADGVDCLGQYFCIENNISYELCIPDWKNETLPVDHPQYKNFNRGAGFFRNEVMAKKCNGAIVIWNNESKGSYHMINYLKNHCKIYPKLKTMFVKDTEEIVNEYERIKRSLPHFTQCQYMITNKLLR